MNHTLTKVFASECIQLTGCIEILGEIRRLKLRIGSLAHVVFCKLTIAPHGTAQQSATEGSVSERGDAAADGVWQDIALNLALKEIVRWLNRVKRRNGSEALH